MLKRHTTKRRSALIEAKYTEISIRVDPILNGIEISS
jgi:hypothetical protein